VLTYDGVRLRVAATSDDELQQFIREAAAWSIYAG